MKPFLRFRLWFWWAVVQRHESVIQRAKKAKASATERHAAAVKKLNEGWNL